VATSTSGHCTTNVPSIMYLMVQALDGGATLLFSHLTLPGFSALDYTVTCKTRPFVHLSNTATFDLLTQENAIAVADEFNGITTKPAPERIGVLRKRHFWMVVGGCVGAGPTFL
jgi:hypothetical protein